MKIIFNNSLIHLNLSVNKIENIDKLIESLKYNTSLKKLSLYYNNIKNIDKHKLIQINNNIKIYF